MPVDELFVGKPDIYHALQACLIPLYPGRGQPDARHSGVRRAPPSGRQAPRLRLRNACPFLFEAH